MRLTRTPSCAGWRCYNHHRHISTNGASFVTPPFIQQQLRTMSYRFLFSHGYCTNGLVMTSFDLIHFTREVEGRLICLFCFDRYLRENFLKDIRKQSEKFNNLDGVYIHISIIEFTPWPGAINGCCTMKYYNNPLNSICSSSRHRRRKFHSLSAQQKGHANGELLNWNDRNKIFPLQMIF